MTNPVDALRAAIAAVTFPKGRLAWLGELQDEIPQSLPPDIRPDHLRLQVTQCLYANFYLAGAPVPTSLAGRARRDAFSREEAHDFSEANVGRGQSQNDWAIVAEERDAFRVQRAGGPTLWASPNEIIRLGGARGARLTVPNEMLRYFPSFYCALGNVAFASRETARVRVYWNVRPGAAPSFLADATRRLNEAGSAFLIKAAYKEAARVRCDNFLVVVERDSIASLRAIREIHAEHRSDLRPATPALTKRLGRGIAAAEDPASRESFGWHRCGLIAEALVNYGEAQTGSDDARLERVAKAFASAGVTVSEPWGDVGQFGSAAAISDRRRGPNCQGFRFNPFSTAEEIGRELVDDAIWFGDRCSWIGSDPLDVRALDAPPSSSLLEADLYDGAAGVALFLAELGARTGDTRTMNCAVAALRHAIVRTSDCSPSSTCGLYQGPLSVAVAAARAGALLSSDELIDRASTLCLKATDVGLDGLSFDLLGGRAGAILALVLVTEELGDPKLLASAQDIADRLVGDGRTGDGDRTLSWRSARAASEDAITGLAHGTSGVAHALFELSVATGEARWRDAARRALNYERASFDTKRGRWRDLRPRTNESGDRFAMAWCHGTPGMAVPRIRALELSPDDALERELQAALSATLNSVAAGAGSIRANFSLCHGLLGNLEILLEAKRLLGGAIGIDLAGVEGLAADGAELYASHARDWPCGGGDGSSPSLMLGLSGIGLFYLRLSDPTVPSIVVPRRV
jgi:hypothetical protein